MYSTRSTSPRGFTLLELLIVMGIIVLLMTISVTAMRAVVQSARIKSTDALIRRVHGLLQQRMAAAATHLGPNKAILSDDLNTEGRYPAMTQAIKDARLVFAYAVNQADPALNAAVTRSLFNQSYIPYLKILARKEAMRQNFPQRFGELNGLNSAPGEIGDDGGVAGVADFHDAPANLRPDLGEYGSSEAGYFGAGALATRDVYPDVAIFANHLRQFAERPDPQNPMQTMGERFRDNHQPHTASSALLYMMLTQCSVFGVPPVDASEFSSTEVQDTDNDGLLEFVDVWGNPLRFYRWPTCLYRTGYDANNDGDTLDATNLVATIPPIPTEDVRPGFGGFNTEFQLPNPPAPLANTNAHRAHSTLAQLLIKSAPIPTTLERAPLEFDPDDGVGYIYGELRNLARENGRLDTPTAQTRLRTLIGVMQAVYHTPDTFFTALIVSPGPDGANKPNGGAEGLGLYEPYEITGNPLTDTFGYLAAPKNPNFDQDLSGSPLLDNITNRN